MERWWNDTTDENGDASFVIVEAKLHDPPSWKREVLSRVSTIVSNATAMLLERVQKSLVVTPDAEDPEQIGSADLVFTVEVEHAERVRKLLSQEKLDKKTGERLFFTNAYRFIACEAIPEEPKHFRVAARLARGIWEDKTDRKGNPHRVYRMDLIDTTTGLQQLLASYFAPGLLRDVPTALRGGVCQEVGQQVGSFLGQLTSRKVKGEVNFPTIEDRDPARRRQVYEQAVDRLMRDLRPLNYARVRDVFPGKYAADDPRGDRLIVHDERWFVVTRSPNPHPIPLLFADGNKVKLLAGQARFDAGISKADRHRGNLAPNERVFDGRPTKVQDKGHTGLQSWYAAIPILDLSDEAIRTVLARRNPDTGRGLDQSFRLQPLQGGGAWKPSANEMLVPLSGNRDRLERILRRKDLEIAWTRLMRSEGEWYLQITLRVRCITKQAGGHVLGISFGIDAIATWHLLDEQGATVSTGSLSPNEQIATFLNEKQNLEWDQAKGRWIGGKGFDRQLESIAHDVANRLLDLAEKQGATLAVEDISYVQKASRDHAANVLFTAWNYGQLRRFLDYKAPLASQPVPLYASDYVTNLTCPKCGAIRGKDEKPERAKTWRENGSLHCRKCAGVTPITPATRAERTARHGLDILSKRALAAARKQNPT